jgi:hypothetical protein
MAEVNARPDAWPAFLMLAISASLLYIRNSLSRGLSGLTVFDADILLRTSPSWEDCDGRSRERREREKLMVLISAYISEASEMIEGREWARRSISPL